MNFQHMLAVFTHCKESVTLQNNEVENSFETKASALSVDSEFSMKTTVWLFFQAASYTNWQNSTNIKQE